jgi:Dyp-type peroxidase family
MTRLATPGEHGGLPLGDIQGNILTGYGKTGFPKARYLLINVRDAEVGRAFVRCLFPKVTTAVRWPSRKYGHFGNKRVDEAPKVALNLAFTFWGLHALGVPVRVLDAFPDEFIDGMARRRVILGDKIRGAPDPTWDRVWDHEDQSDSREMVHILITLNAQMTPDGQPVAELDELTQTIRNLCAGSDGKLTLMGGHDAAGADVQELSALMDTVGGGDPKPAPREHFGFADGISDPVFAGQLPPSLEEVRAPGNGKMGSDGVWRPLATGEFLLGYPDEAQEIPVPGPLRVFGRHGTFIAYRKLQQNVVAFRDWITTTAERFGGVYGIGDPDAARATLLAKLVGRWPDGAPLSLFPNFESWQTGAETKVHSLAGRRELSNFAYFDDPAGVKCPMSAHTRRANPRDGNGPLFSDGTRPSLTGTVLNDRRRILRRGLPFGVADPAASSEGEHGIVMLVMCASLSRQFEFMQQQWVNYGADAHVGNDTDPLIGLHGPKAKFVIPADPIEGRAPFIADALPQFVGTRGGAYFFYPGMNALMMLGMGIIDPT